MAGPLTAQDRIDVIELIGSYAHYLDSKDLDGYVSNFSEDGTFDGTDGSGGHTGRDVLREYVGNLMTKPRPVPMALHFMGLPHIEGDSERCTARTYIAWFQPNEDGSLNMPAVGLYKDTCKKVDGKWFFERREVRPSIGKLR